MITTLKDRVSDALKTHIAPALELDGSGIEVIKRCAALYPHCSILVITMFGDEKNVLSSVEAGASGYILKDSDHFDVSRAMLELLAGGSPPETIVTTLFLDDLLDRTPDRPPERAYHQR